MDGKIIKLSKPVEAFGKPYNEIALKEPTGALFARLGHPRIAVINQTVGSGYWVERDDVISTYLDKLLSIDDPTAIPLVLQQLALADMIELREALFSFFEEARLKSVGQKVAEKP